MNISQDQIRAVEQGEAVRLHADDVELVVLRADLYERLAGVSDSPREAYPAVLKALGDDDPDQFLEYLDETR
jgi:hypothetical protein